MSDILELTRRWLEVLPEGRFDEFPDGIAPDLVLRLPFVPPGVPTEIAGRENVRERVSSTAQNRSPLVLTDVVSLMTEDPALVVTTAKGNATMANGKIYENSYVMLTRFRDGQVVEHTEYLNPLAVMATYAD